MYKHLILSSIALFALAVNAQSADEKINIRGKVTCKGKAVADAVVTLAGMDLKDTTDEKGEYLIQSIVSVFPTMKPQAEKIVFNKGVLELRLLKSSPVKIEVFDVNGSLIKKEVSQNTAAGVYRMNVAEMCNASKLLVIQASIGANSMTYRYLPFSNSKYALSSINKNNKPIVNSRLAKVAAIVDSLIVEKEGYVTKIVPVELYDDTVDISLDTIEEPVFLVEDEGYDCEVTSPSGSNGGSSNVLPDPFTKWDGTQVKTMKDWRCRRRELLVEIEKRILGEKAPPPSKIGGKVSGSITTQRYEVIVENPKGTISFSGKVSLPKSGSAPYPAVIVLGSFNSLNSDVLSSEGIATMEYDNYGIASEASGNYSTGKYYQANPDYKNKTSALVAWAWGVSRIIDMLEQNPDVIDPTKIAIHGCSRLGKGAFVIGAFDQRITGSLHWSLVLVAQLLSCLAIVGRPILSSCNGEASWFGPMSKSYSSNMAVDMSDVAALYAPRGLLMMDNPHIDHLSYKANYLGCAAAFEVYKAMGREDALWYLGNSGNGNHCSVRQEYGDPLRAMIKKFLKGDQTVKTGGLDKHSNHGNIDVSGWTKGWKKETFSE